MLGQNRSQEPRGRPSSPACPHVSIPELHKLQTQQRREHVASVTFWTATGFSRARPSTWGLGGAQGLSRLPHTSQHKQRSGTEHGSLPHPSPDSEVGAAAGELAFSHKAPSLSFQKQRGQPHPPDTPGSTGRHCAPGDPPGMRMGRQQAPAQLNLAGLWPPVGGDPGAQGSFPSPRGACSALTSASPPSSSELGFPS